jgi:hypothetical protein
MHPAMSEIVGAFIHLREVRGQQGNKDSAAIECLLGFLSSDSDSRKSLYSSPLRTRLLCILSFEFGLDDVATSTV